MTVLRIGTLAQSEFALSRMLSLQADVFDKNAQISSGVKAQRFSGLGTDAKRLVSLEASLVKVRNYSATNKLVDDRLQVMESQSSTLFDLTSKFRVTLLQAQSGGLEDELDLVNQGQGFLNQVANILNIRQGGQYIFGGGRMDNPPVDLSAPLFSAPPAVYPSSSSVRLEAGANAQSLASQGMTISFDENTVNSGDAYRISYDYTDATNANLTLTNTVTGISSTVNVAPQLNSVVGVPGADLGATQTSGISFPGLGVTVTVDSNFDRDTDIITTGTLDAAAIGTPTFTTLTSTNATTAVTLDGIQALRALDPSVYDPDTGLMTLQVVDDGATVTFSAAGVDLGAGVGVATTDRTGAGSVDVLVGGHRLATIDHTGVATGGVGAGTITIDVGNRLFGQVTPAYYQGDERQLTVRADENTEITYGITAKEPAYEKLIRALHLVATNPSLDLDRIREADRLMVEVINELPDVISRIGLDRSALEQINAKHDNIALLTEETVGELKFVDVAEALIQLQTSQVSLEASFSTIVRMGQLNLVNFL